MTPHLLADTLWKTFAVKLTPEELGALVLFLDKDGNRLTSKGELMSGFWRLGHEEARRKRRERGHRTRKWEQQEERMRAREALRWKPPTTTRVVFPVIDCGP